MTARTRQMTEQIQQWLRRRLSATDTYHPERHYMRGPGPKCMAKAGMKNSDPGKTMSKESKA